MGSEMQTKPRWQRTPEPQLSEIPALPAGRQRNSRSPVRLVKFWHAWSCGQGSCVYGLHSGGSSVQVPQLVPEMAVRHSYSSPWPPRLSQPVPPSISQTCTHSEVVAVWLKRTQASPTSQSCPVQDAPIGTSLPTGTHSAPPLGTGFSITHLRLGGQSCAMGLQSSIMSATPESGAEASAAAPASAVCICP